MYKILSCYRTKHKFNNLKRKVYLSDKVKGKTMNISVAIADTNREYLKRLVEVLQEHEELSVSVFTSAEKLVQALETSRFDIVLFDPDISEDKLKFYNAKLWMCLYSEDAQNTALYSECEKVIKYQRVSKLYKEVIKAYADKAGYMAAFDYSQNTKIVAVYSPIGGSGKTTLALAIASKYAVQGENVLYMNTEQLDSSSCLESHERDSDDVTVLLEAVAEKSNFELKLKGIIKKGLNGISFIEGFERFVDYNTVTKTEFVEIIEKIRRNGEFDVVVIDMGTAMDEINQTVFEQSDGIVLVDKPGDIETKKMEMFRQQALTREHLGKMYMISNFVDRKEMQNSQMDISAIGNVRNYGKQPLKNLIQLIIAKETIQLNQIMKKTVSL